MKQTSYITILNVSLRFLYLNLFFFIDKKYGSGLKPNDSWITHLLRIVKKPDWIVVIVEYKIIQSHIVLKFWAERV